MVVNASSTPSGSPAETAGDARLRELVEEITRHHPAAARLAWLIERVRLRPPLPPAMRTDAHLVPGCLSRLWLVMTVEDGRCRMACDSDSRVVRAVAGLLCDLADGLSPAELLALDPEAPARLDLAGLLTPNRRAAHSRVWTEIRSFARAQRDSTV